MTSRMKADRESRESSLHRAV